MTEKRWFYRDSLAAAWMAKHYGMEFQNTSLSMRVVEYEMCGVVVQERGKSNIEIHPDSLCLLKPRMHDLIIAKGYNGIDTTGYIVELNTFHETGAFRIDTCEKIIFTEEQAKIIQRNGQPFFWPESEEA